MLLIWSSLKERKRFTAIPLNYYLPNNPTGELLCAHSCRLRGGTVPESCVSVDKDRAVICGGDKATGIVSRSLIVWPALPNCVCVSNVAYEHHTIWQGALSTCEKTRKLWGVKALLSGTNSTKVWLFLIWRSTISVSLLSQICLFGCGGVLRLGPQRVF